METDTPTVGDLLVKAASRADVGLRLLDRTEKATWYPWPEIYRRSIQTSGALQRMGVSRGDRVALVFPTSIDFFEAFFGAILAGAIPVPLYPPIRLGRLEEYALRTSRMLSSVTPRLVLADHRVRRLLGPAVAGVSPELGCFTLREMDHARGNPIAHQSTDLALIQFSSGTTVDPKPVGLSHRAVVAQATALNSHWPDTDDCVHSGVSWLPLYHDMGLIGCVITALERPGSMTFIPPEAFLTRPAVWLRTISRYRATVSVAPNFGYGFCIDRIRDDELDGVDLSNWRIGLNGAEQVIPRVMRRFQRRFEPWGLRSETLTPVYGLSEATLAVTFSSLDKPFVSRKFDRGALSGTGHAVETPDGVEIVSVGSPIEGCEVRVVDGDRHDLADNHVGRILVRGSSVMDGYFERPDTTGEVFDGDWLDTGDLGFKHDSELYITGRSKDILILRGRSHSPTEIEAAMDSVDGARVGCSVAVSWLPDDADGEIMLLLVEAKRGVHPDSFADIGERCRVAARAATGLTADIVEVLAPGTLPRTSSGKLRRQEALRRYRFKELSPPDRVTPLKLAGVFVRSSLQMARMRWTGRD